MAQRIAVSVAKAIVYKSLRCPLVKAEQVIPLILGLRPLLGDYLAYLSALLVKQSSKVGLGLLIELFGLSFDLTLHLLTVDSKLLKRQNNLPWT